ncbi:phosphate signaling complex protein PhoU [soil metagenome]
MPVNAFYLTQIERLQASIVRMGNLAGKQLGDAVAAFVAKDTVLASEVIQRDEDLDRLEDEHEELTIQIIALNQPVARDLRFLVALLRINSTIERAADIASKVAKATIRLSDKPTIKPYVDIPRNYELVRSMWDDSIKCFETMDEALASELRDRDDILDRANEETIRQLIEISMENPSYIYQTTNFIGVSKAFEKIGDLGVDIADEVIYARRGILRHQRTERHTA